MSDKLIGESIGPRYRIVEKIGSGGLGAVYKVLDTRSQRLLALKVFHLSYSADAKKVFLREAMALGRLKQHPNIVQIYEAGETDTLLFYLVFEYVEGRTLDQIMKDARPPVLDYAIEIIRQVGAGLAYAHQNGIIHRDVKPSNILISNDGRVLLADFGLAVPPGARTLTQSGTVLGTPAYMSPEQVMGKPVDARSDIFSLGVVFYELLTGRKPFSGESAAELFRNIVKEVPKSPRQIDSSIPISISEIVLKSLAKEPSQRFQTADSFVGALAGANLRPRQNKAAETGESMPLGRGDIDIEVARRTAATSSSSAEHLRSRWFAFAFAVLLVCFVLVLFGWMPFLRGFGEHGRGGPKLLAALAAALVLWLLWRSYTVRERRGRWGDLPSLMGSVPPQSSDSRVTGQFQPNGQEPTLRRPEPEDREATQDELIPYSPPPFGSVEVLTYPNAIAWLISLGDQDHGREIRLGDMSLSAGLMTTT